MEETILTKIQAAHKLILKLINEIETSQDYFQRVELFNRAKAALVAHIEGEEKTIYSRLCYDLPKESVDNVVYRSNREHHEIKEYLQRLNLMNFGSSDWLTVFKQFKNVVQEHCADEMNMFTEVKKSLSERELIEIAKQYEAAKNSSHQIN